MGLRVPFTVETPAQPSRRAERWPGDADRLARLLRGRVQGEVRFDAGSRGAYATDASNYRQVPIGVVVPRTTEDVLATLDACRELGAPVVSRGGGTSLAGQTCNVAVVMDFSKHLREIVDVDPGSRTARVQPGLVLDDLAPVTRPHGLRFAPDPATHSRCTIGGMLGNNSCGAHSLMAGKTVDNTASLEVVTYDGARMEVGPTPDEELASIVAGTGRRAEIYAGLRDLRDAHAEDIRARFPDIPRRVSGFNLDQLLPESGFHVARALVGSEGTCVTVLEATVELAEDPPARVLVLLGYPDVFSAADAVPELLEHGPIGLEGFDGFLIDNLRRKGQKPEARELLPDGGGWLIAEFGGESPAEAERHARALVAALDGPGPTPDARLVTHSAAQQRIWEVREAGVGAAALAPGRPLAWPGWEDSAVPPDRMGAYLRDLRGLLDGYGYDGAMYGHFGDGCLHIRIPFDLYTAEGVRTFRSFMGEAAELVLGYGGSLSGEHGDGQARGELLERMFGAEMTGAFRRFKALWDPDGRMNPGKLVDAAGVDQHLRLGSDYRPWEPATAFALPADGGRLAHAALRCVGVGECRKTGSGTMCPSYMATREEIHSTRGRARLLWEMLEGDPVRDGWRDRHVEEALDLCLSCKACKSECPVNVDMATYKAEFFHHRYKGQLRPRQAYALGLVPLWARLACRLPRWANLATHAPGLARLVKRAAGVHPDRDAPAFAEQTLAQWFAERRTPATTGPPALLWLDTFTNHFEPDVGRAAVEILEQAGYTVELPPQPVCCARPLYEYGMLDTAKRLLRRDLDALTPQLRDGTPVVVLEPSCAAVFRDELGELLAGDQDASRLAAQAMTLAELLVRDGYQPPARIHRRVVVQRHCHQAAVIGFAPDAEILRRLGVDAELLDSGCCGMAGSFGYEERKYDVSVAVGERVLLPRARQEHEDTLFLADGFSCRSQLSDLTGRRALHLAQLLRLAHGGAQPAPAPTPLPRRRTLAVLAVAAVGAGAAAAAVRSRGS